MNYVEANYRKYVALLNAPSHPTLNLPSVSRLLTPVSPQTHTAPIRRSTVAQHFFDYWEISRIPQILPKNRPHTPKTAIFLNFEL